jgi:hypothetical protein
MSGWTKEDQRRIDALRKIDISERTYEQHQKLVALRRREQAEVFKRRKRYFGGRS